MTARSHTRTRRREKARRAARRARAAAAFADQPGTSFFESPGRRKSPHSSLPSPEVPCPTNCPTNRPTDTPGGSDER